MFERQPAHIALLLGLLWGVHVTLDGLGLDASVLVWSAVGVAVAHHLWVLVFWRLELHRQQISRVFGHPAGFRVYQVGFVLLAAGRIGLVWWVALNDPSSLGLPRELSLIMTALLCALFVWLIISVRLYFGMERAFGIDHWEPERFRGTPLLRRGIHRLTPNAMYVFVPSILWAADFAYDSPSAMVVAAFNTVYLWVHYFCLEKPDLRRIYGGETRAEPASRG